MSNQNHYTIRSTPFERYRSFAIRRNEMNMNFPQIFKDSADFSKKKIV